MNPTRNACFAAAIDLINQKKEVLRSALAELSNDVESEGKSTAGDKHETGRAMLNIEQDRLARQLSALDDQEAALYRLRQGDVQPHIAPGSLIQTNRGWLFLAVALGRITVNTQPVMTLSADSPLGSMLLAKSAHDTIAFNGVEYSILLVA